MSASASSECPDGYENHGKAYDVLDNDASTYWHSDWTVDGHTLPQWVMITLDQPSAISQMDVLPRDSGNGSITDYEIYVSETGEDDSFVLLLRAHGMVELTWKRSSLMSRSRISQRSSSWLWDPDILLMPTMSLLLRKSICMARLEQARSLRMR